MGRLARRGDGGAGAGRGADAGAVGRAAPLPGRAGDAVRAVYPVRLRSHFAPADATVRAGSAQPDRPRSARSGDGAVARQCRRERQIAGAQLRLGKSLGPDRARRDGAGRRGDDDRRGRCGARRTDHLGQSREGALSRSFRAAHRFPPHGVASGRWRRTAGRSRQDIGRERLWRRRAARWPHASGPAPGIVSEPAPGHLATAVDPARRPLRSAADHATGADGAGGVQPRAIAAAVRRGRRRAPGGAACHAAGAGAAGARRAVFAICRLHRKHAAQIPDPRRAALRGRRVRSAAGRSR